MRRVRAKLLKKEAGSNLRLYKLLKRMWVRNPGMRSVWRKLNEG